MNVAGADFLQSLKHNLVSEVGPIAFAAEMPKIKMAKFGGHSIRGSTTHTGARALRDYYDALVKQGLSPSITPDGPKGPRFVFKPGAILLSQMSQRPILPISWCASRATLFAWDKFVLPWPFSRIVIAVGPPRQVPRIMQPAALEAMQKEMAAELKRLFGVARDELRSS